MGTPGVKINIPKARILAAIHKYKGVGYRICEALDIGYTTFTKIMRSDPEFAEALDMERNAYGEELCDLAESVIGAALKRHETDMNNALSASKFVLNNKGRRRGYIPPSSQIVEVDPTRLEPMKELIATVAEAGRQACRRLQIAKSEQGTVLPIDPSSLPTDASPS